MATRVIDIGAGEHVTIDEVGSDGRGLLLVHGFTGGRVDFADHMEALAEAGWWVVAPDLRGHGDSWHPEDESEYSFDHFAGDMLSLVDALGWDRFVLLGHSMGGMIAQVAAAKRPGALDGLVLMDTTHGPLEIDRELAMLGAEIVREGGMAAVKEAMDALEGDGPLGTPANQRLLDERPGYRELGDQKFLGSSPAMYASMIGQMIDQLDRLQHLADLSVPTLVIVGEQDAPFLGPSEAMATAVPGARLEVITDAGHSPQFENPDAWRAVMLDFLAGV
ncbi:alpha/beta hydrolase [Acidimicrobiia bacterium EGI L10123]|uniref:alpha/beta fold hydrolase n=1 Tax=Salinilacustrithrix flava TaxID=2957203 RepID=UPI003D7C18E4|nr:alpha/beta hydrolase [Acidimicrobiia bacterium EGI L10123]